MGSKLAKLDQVGTNRAKHLPNRLKQGQTRLKRLLFKGLYAVQDGLYVVQGGYMLFMVVTCCSGGLLVCYLILRTPIEFDLEFQGSGVATALT